MSYIQYECNERIGYITLNRPEKRNALNSQMVEQLKEAFILAIGDAACKVIVLKANGQAFCAGADLQYLQDLQQFTYDENLEDSRSLRDLFLMIHRSPKIVIAQVEGHALAGGCGLATVCDFCFSVPEAKFGYTEVKIGFIPALVMVFLIRKIGEGKSREMLLTGDVMSAQKALEYGLITQVSGASVIAKEVNELAKRLVDGVSSQSVAKVKEMIYQLQHLSLEDGLEMAAKANATARESDDCKKGISSFLQKDPLQW